MNFLLICYIFTAEEEEWNDEASAAERSRKRKYNEGEEEDGDNDMGEANDLQDESECNEENKADENEECNEDETFEGGTILSSYKLARKVCLVFNGLSSLLKL